jgi:hypothetical protein
MRLASTLMMRFAERTHILDASAPPARYLWTDAFAVCNFIEMGRNDLALALVDRVHRTLGRYSPEDTRTGWISGLEAHTAELHPTIGGLRIGKPLPERKPSEPFNERLEWDRDGQYFHYLTKWMHALDQLTYATGDPSFNKWARELAESAFRRFVHGSPPTMYWKMSVDLSRPLVSSMGQHDPLDGYVTCLELMETAADFGVPGIDLREASAGFGAMVDPTRLATVDPLGIGGLLVDAYRIAHLPVRDPALVFTILNASRLGLAHYVAEIDLQERASHRLAFRELGLAIGLAAMSKLPELAARTGLDRHLSLRQDIEAFWLRPENREVRTWVEHADINDVMLATSLAPEGFLHVSRGGRSESPIAPTYYER